VGEGMDKGQTGQMNTLLEETAGKFRRALIALGVFSLFATLLQLTLPLYMLQVYDRVLPSQSTDTLIFLSILAGFALITLGLTEMVRKILVQRASVRFDTSLSDHVLKHILTVGRYSAQREQSDTQPLRDLQSVRGLIASPAMIGLVDLPFTTIFIACLYLIHPDLFWITIAGVVVLAIVALINLRASRNSSIQQTYSANGAQMRADHYARNADSIQAMGMTGNVIEAWGDWNAGALLAGDRSGRISAFFGGLSRTLRFGLQALMLGYGAWLVQNGEMTAGMIFASSIISGRALAPIDVVINSWPQIAMGRQAWARVRDYMGNQPKPRTHTDLGRPNGDLKVEQLMQPNAMDRSLDPVLNRVSFELTAGSSVAIIGPSGSGKTTLARVLVGALKPFAGSVRLDGHDLENWESRSLGKFLGYVPQDVELLPGTIAQNIARFEPDATDEDIRKAAALAHVEDLIRRLPKGYDTPVGPGGTKVSGGERQRIALARAFYGDPRLLVLDEPNSSLDRLGEQALLKALEAAKQAHITVVLITQRENVIHSVDHILRLKNGRVVDFGERTAILEAHSRRRRSTDNKEARPVKIVSNIAAPSAMEG